jgi:aminopeptidase N
LILKSFSEALEQMQVPPRQISILNGLVAQTPDVRMHRRSGEAVAKVQKNLGTGKAVKEEMRTRLD